MSRHRPARGNQISVSGNTLFCLVHLFIFCGVTQRNNSLDDENGWSRLQLYLILYILNRWTSRKKRTDNTIIIGGWSGSTLWLLCTRSSLTNRQKTSPAQPCFNSFSSLWLIRENPCTYSPRWSLSGECSLTGYQLILYKYIGCLSVFPTEWSWYRENLRMKLENLNRKIKISKTLSKTSMQTQLCPKVAQKALHCGFFHPNSVFTTAGVGEACRRLLAE